MKAKNADIEMEAANHSMDIVNISLCQYFLSLTPIILHRSQSVRSHFQQSNEKLRRNKKNAPSFKIK